MTLIEETVKLSSHNTTISDLLPNACVSYEDTDLLNATYFELRPVCDGQNTCTSYLYGDDSNYVQIRMGHHGRPCELIAKYRYEYASYACRDFFELAQLQKPLWYSGNDILVQVTDIISMVSLIAEDRFDKDDAELQELFENVGLDENERVSILTKLHLQSF